METLFDVIGVLMILWGSFAAFVVLLQAIGVLFISRDVGLGKSTTGLVTFIFIVVAGAFSVAVIWGGFALTGVNQW